MGRSYYAITRRDSNELMHHGVKGQKWGVRRYQNEDGTLTDAGKKKYIQESDGSIRKKKWSEKTGGEKAKTIAKGAAITAGVLAAATASAIGVQSLRSGASYMDTAKSLGKKILGKSGAMYVGTDYYSKFGSQGSTGLRGQGAAKVDRYYDPWTRTMTSQQNVLTWQQDKDNSGGTYSRYGNSSGRGFTSTTKGRINDPNLRSGPMTTGDQHAKFISGENSQWKAREGSSDTYNRMAGDYDRAQKRTALPTRKSDSHRRWY